MYRVHRCGDVREVKRQNRNVDGIFLSNSMSYLNEVCLTISELANYARLRSAIENKPEGRISAQYFLSC